MMVLGQNVHHAEKPEIDIRAGARLKAPDCLIHTNIKAPEAIKIGASASVNAGIICAVGGVQNSGGTVEATVIDTCPKVRNPMDTRTYPAVGQDCKGKDL